MKIGIVLSMFPEPHETFILREIAELERQGLDFEVFSLQRPKDAMTHPDAVRLGARTQYGALFGARAWGAFLRTCVEKPLRLLRAVGALAAAGWRQPRTLAESLAILPLTLAFGRRMRACGVTHLHGHWRNVPTTACWILEIVEGLPWSAAIHGEDIFTPNPFLARKLAHARFIAVCTKYSWRHLREKMDLSRPEDVHLNYHGLDRLVWEAAGQAKELPAERKADDAFVILAVGRLFEFKGYDYLLPAVATLASEGLDARLRIVGRGPREARLRRLAETLGIASRVEFCGYMPFGDVLDAMQRADVLCQASVYMRGDHFDGIPNVIAEAMALGTPVVATVVSGIPELVENGASGLLVPERDSAALADALRRVHDHPDEAAARAKKACETVRTLFDQQRNVSELIQLFERYAGNTDHA